MEIKHLVHFGSRIAWMHLNRRSRIPLSVHIVLTNRCNLKCKYCSVHDLPQDDVWSTKTLKDVIREMYECGVRRIHFTGGEPMLRKDLGELISYTKNLGIFVTFVSNGFQIEERINEIKDVDVVFLSYDGTPEVHRLMRGQRNLDEFNRALLSLKSAGINVWTTTVLTRLSAKYLEDTIDFARRQHVMANFTRLEFFTEPPNHLHPMMDQVKDLVLRGDERIEVYKKLIQLKRAGAPIGSTLEYLENGMEWPHDNKVYDTKTSKRYGCWAGRAYGHLEADGELYACGTGVSRIRGKSVLKTGFRSAWEQLPLLENCKSCSHACGVESNLIFSLNVKSILNHLFCLRDKK